MKRFFGNYLGIVIDDQDPEFKNRVQVYVPAISHTLLTELNAKKKDIILAQRGNNFKNDIGEKIYQDLRRVLPWAECAVPLFGGGTSVHYNPETKISSNKNNIGLDTDSSNSTSSETNPIQANLTNADIIKTSEPGTQKDVFSGGADELEDIKTDLAKPIPNSKPLDDDEKEKEKKSDSSEGGLEEEEDTQEEKDDDIYGFVIKTDKDDSSESSGMKEDDQKSIGHYNKAKPKNKEFETPEYNYAKNTDILNENSYDITGTQTSIIPGGVFSTPKINSHVWVFFNEGDPTYPVYFAHHVVREDWQRIKQQVTKLPEQEDKNESKKATDDKSEKKENDIDKDPDLTYTQKKKNEENSDSASADSVKPSPPTKLNISNKHQKNIISTIAQPSAGLIEFICQQNFDQNTKTTEEFSGIKISTGGGNVISLMTNGNSEYSPSNKTVKVAGNSFLTVENYSETAVKSSATTIVGEDNTLIVGDVSEQSIKSSNKIKDILNEGYKKCIESHQNPSDKKVKCPICHTKIIKDSGTLAAKIESREKNAPLNLISRDSVGIRAVKPMLSVASWPAEEVVVKDIRGKGKSCGNPLCKDNMIPDFTENMPKIEQTFVDYLTDKKTIEEIVENEEKTGIGGNITEVVSRNYLTKVGNIINDLPAHAVCTNAFPIKNGIEFITKTGSIPKGDAIDVYKTIDAPHPQAGSYDIIAGNKFTLKVGSKGILIQTVGNIELESGICEITASSIHLNNRSGITRITGAAVVIESEKSITLGGAPTNVHVNGSVHVTANTTVHGSSFVNGTVYAKRLIMPSSMQRTDTSSNADYTTAMSLWNEGEEGDGELLPVTADNQADDTNNNQGPTTTTTTQPTGGIFENILNNPDTITTTQEGSADYDVSSSGEPSINDDTVRRTVLTKRPSPAAEEKTDLTILQGGDQKDGPALRAFKRNLQLKQEKHYNNELHGMFTSTKLGMEDIALDWITMERLKKKYDNLENHVGLAIGEKEDMKVYLYPHIHLVHATAHEHSFKGPEGQYTNDADEVYELAALTGNVVPDVI